ncbi:MAG: hypothetical protein MUF18_19625, partial [Fimbriiglobus sp.]|nr:hypothetical protein [Fimbriiglobus sp.]
MARLTPRRRQSLLFMVVYRDANPSAADLVAANWRPYLALVLYFALVGAAVGTGIWCGFGAIAVP